VNTNKKSSAAGTIILDLSVEPRATRVLFETRRGRRFLTIMLVDGRMHSVPLTFYPTLAKAPPAARNRFRPIGGGIGFHWPQLDFDLPVRGLLEGRRESVQSPRARKAG